VRRKWGCELTSTNQRRRNALDWITSVALIGAAGVVIWSEWPKFGPGISPTALAIPKDPVELGRRTLLGSQDAPTLLVEFTDVECPFCATFARDTLPEINRLFVETGRLAVALVSLPLAIHTHARDGARALECADEQAKLWPLATLLFRIPQGDLSAERIRGAALAAGVEPRAFDACRSSGAQTHLDSDIEMAHRLGIRSTPTFLIGQRLPNNRLLVKETVAGALPVAEFVELLNAHTKR